MLIVSTRLASTEFVVNKELNALLASQYICLRNMPFPNTLCMFMDRLENTKLSELLIHTKGILSSLLTHLTTESFRSQTDMKIFDCLVKVINLVRTKDQDEEEGTVVTHRFGH